MAKSAKKSAKTAGGESTTVKVSVKPAKPGDDPVVVSFARGVPPSILDAEEDAISSSTHRAVQFEESRAHDVPTFTWSKLKANSNRGKSLVGSDKTCVYSASNEGRGYDGRAAKLYVGIYNKEKGTLTLQPAAEKGQVFSLAQGVKSYREEIAHADAAMKNMTASEKRMMLFDSFGSAKKQRALRSQAANVVNIDSVISAGDTMLEAVQRQDMGETNRRAMEDAAAGKPKIDPTEVALKQARLKFLPQFDENAEKPHDVYSSRAIAGEAVWSNISNIVTACTKQEGDWRDHLTGRGFWFGSVKKLLNTINMEDRKAPHQIKSAVLLNQLMKFHQNANKNFFYGTPEELAKKFAISNDLAPRFLELFATPSNDRGKDGYSITRPLKDKRLIHILIVYLIAHGREMMVGSIDAFCEDLQCEVSTASMLLREAGCAVKKSKAGTSVSLKTPLAFPPPRRGKRP